MDSNFSVVFPVVIGLTVAFITIGYLINRKFKNIEYQNSVLQKQHGKVIVAGIKFMVRKRPDEKVTQILKDIDLSKQVSPYISDIQLDVSKRKNISVFKDNNQTTYNSIMKYIKDNSLDEIDEKVQEEDSFIPVTDNFGNTHFIQSQSKQEGVFYTDSHLYNQKYNNYDKKDDLKFTGMSRWECSAIQCKTMYMREQQTEESIKLNIGDQQLDDLERDIQ
ncbi:UNKNOWN [Stylonychia lemnae]|uniref:Transmembrane protein n=1 Tax=Stylonychia lemnae TaxID=5949 RepID=A0A078AFY2_STYLE|nr:UNKNOWN [Stylonychia lemnae]|eukprot:CDW81134.1 UNKNOWN [Stylonychia lemnae]